MSINFTEMKEAVDDARATISRADNFIGDMARMCRGKLRSSNVDIYTLEALKRELADYNIHASSWREK